MSHPRPTAPPWKFDANTYAGLPLMERHLPRIAVAAGSPPLGHLCFLLSPCSILFLPRVEICQDRFVLIATHLPQVGKQTQLRFIWGCEEPSMNCFNEVGRFGRGA